MKELTIPISAISNPDSVMSVEITPQFKNELNTIASKPNLRLKPNRVDAAHKAMVQHGFITNSHHHIIENCFTEFKMKHLSRKIG